MTCFYTHFKTSTLSCATALLLFCYHPKNKHQLDSGPDVEQTLIQLGTWSQAQPSPTQQQLTYRRMSQNKLLLFKH